MSQRERQTVAGEPLVDPSDWKQLAQAHSWAGEPLVDLDPSGCKQLAVLADDLLQEGKASWKVGVLLQLGAFLS